MVPPKYVISCKRQTLGNTRGLASDRDRSHTVSWDHATVATVHWSSGTYGVHRSDDWVRTRASRRRRRMLDDGHEVALILEDDVFPVVSNLMHRIDALLQDPSREILTLFCQASAANAPGYFMVPPPRTCCASRPLKR